MIGEHSRYHIIESSQCARKRRSFVCVSVCECPCCTFALKAREFSAQFEPSNDPKPFGSGSKRLGALQKAATSAGRSRSITRRLNTINLSLIEAPFGSCSRTQRIGAA